MMAGDDEQQRLFGSRIGRVSRALWPANIRHSVATNRSAQRRRFLLINGRGCLLFFGILFAHCSYVLATLLIMVSSIAVAILGLRFWFLLLIPILMLIAVLITPAIAAARAQYLSEETAPIMLEQGSKSFPGIPASKSFPGFSTARSFPDIPSSQHSPETPMPSELPLIRVLETFDLRQMEIPPDDTSSASHFL